MADYHAVLQRTLSGFTDPKPQLRTKLYERARTTIQRQLEGRTPPMEPEALAAEIQKLEDSIAQIENSYNQDFYTEPDASGETVEAVVEEPTVETPLPVVAGATPEPLPELTSAPVAQPEEISAPESEPVHESLPESEPLPEPGVEPIADMVPEMESVLEGADEPAGIDQAAFAEEFGDGTDLAEQPVEMPKAVDIPDAADLIASSSEEPIATDEKPLAEQQFDAAYEAVAEAVAAPQLSDVPPIPVSPAPAPMPQAFTPAEDSAYPQPSELPAFDPAAADDLTIPPAPGFGAPIKPKRKKRGFFKWLITLLILAGLGAAGYYGWQNKDDLIERFDLGQYINPNDPTRPKPVKTISIAPPPAIGQEEAVAEPQDTPVPKVEKRLTEDGTEVETAVTLPPTTLTPDAGTPGVETDASAPSSSETLATDATTQSAILYEKDNADGRSSDQGRVAWSIVQEEPSAGQPKEPAIRGRVEIPSRNMILIMTIKRNSDKSFPATHLIELVFAVPDDFSGGSIAQISRVVLKDTEQSRGESLLGVPAPIASGIFLYALNNLDEAKQKNVSLLKSQDWIDIPLQYATGRSALITIEKGETGRKVFEEAFAAWDSAS